MSQKIRAVNKACDWSFPILDMVDHEYRTESVFRAVFLVQL